MFEKTKTFFTDGYLLKRFVILIVGLILFRILATIPLPQFDSNIIASIVGQNQLLGVFDIFSGGGLSNLSVAMLGVFPYITVAIVVQLLTVVSPAIHSLYHEEGEIGRKKVSYWSRVATVPVAILNATGILAYFTVQGFLPEAIALSEYISAIVLIVAGSLLLMWIGELITEFGIGNGISFIVFAGIVVNIPVLVNTLLQNIDVATPLADLPFLITIAVGIFVATMFAIWMNEADRPIPITYARYGISHGSTASRVDTYIPIKVNPVGVLSIIFALTVTAFFQFIFRWMSGLDTAALAAVGQAVTDFLAVGFFYAIPLGVLTAFFTYFHAPIVFNVQKVADNIQKQGAFVPGLRPGEETARHFGETLQRIIFYAALFLTTITVVPFFFSGATANTFLFAVGGTGLIIIVSVVMDIHRKVSTRLAHVMGT